MFLYPDYAYFAVAEICGFNTKLLHYSCAMTEYIILSSVIIPLSSVYPRSTGIQNSTIFMP
jgi:hypothetical protein